MIWYKLLPADTLFFRGSESLEMGSDHFAQSLFPPPVSVVYGAIRTCVLSKREIPFKVYSEHKAPEEIYRIIGRPEQSIEELTFTIYGPFFLHQNEVFVPSPLLWYGSQIIENSGIKKKVKFSLYKLLPGEYSIKASKPILWPLNSDNEKDYQITSLSGTWINWNHIVAPPKNKIIEVFTKDFFFTEESRTGIALNLNRRVRTGHLYSLTHIRLKQGIALCIGLDQDPGLREEGTLFLGGEKRFVYYQKFNPDVKDLPTQADLFMALSPVPATQDANASVVITDKLQYRGGWDLARGFHKALEAYFPAGSVFNKKVSRHCLPLKNI
jgi:CRISPR-associated protein Cmr3